MSIKEYNALVKAYHEAKLWSKDSAARTLFERIEAAWGKLSDEDKTSLEDTEPSKLRDKY